MKVYDCSISLVKGMVSWPGDPQFETRDFKLIDKGDSSNILEMKMSSHAGTHIDAPAHFFKDALTVDKIPFDILIGKTQVIDFYENDEISKSDLEKYDLKGKERVLLKTKNSSLYKKDGFQKDYVYLTDDAAGYLVKLGVKLIGIDYLSIQKYKDKESKVHKILLSNNIVIVEALDLSKVPEGEYTLFCLPMKLIDTDGAPTRVILLRKD